MGLVDHAPFGRAVRRVRRAKGMTQEALGDAAGLGMKHVSGIERTAWNPRLETVLKLARGLGIPAGQLLDLADAEAKAHLGPATPSVEHRTCGGRPAILVRAISSSSRLLVLDLANDPLARAAARDYITRAAELGDTHASAALVAALTECEEPEVVVDPNFKPNDKQRERLKVIATTGRPWCPANGGQARMADVLARHGLLRGPSFPERLYTITDAGLAVLHGSRGPQRDAA